ncbi:MAG TPA: maleylpyruvate isomerase N-terminal domain-containing protein, partial [Blastocatellia bacterium]|nr:maleylpyruvate isomerase N-terminal domain-containing protein [Blastocatellia bacterium]
MQINGQFFIASGQSSAMRMKSIEPVFVAELFCQIHGELLSLLRNLSGDDWVKPTAARQWVVKDIAAHLLDGDIRRLSYQRDKAPMVAPETPGAPSSSESAPSSSESDGYRDLVDFLNQL